MRHYPLNSLKAALSLTMHLMPLYLLKFTATSLALTVHLRNIIVPLSRARLEHIHIYKQASTLAGPTSGKGDQPTHALKETVGKRQA
jgi:hypothetical protein